MIWSALANACDVVEPDNVFYFLVSHFHLQSFQIPNPSTNFGDLMVKFYDVRFVFFSVVLNVVHGICQCMSRDVRACGWHGIVNNSCPFVVKVGSSDYDFCKFFIKCCASRLYGDERCELAF